MSDGIASKPPLGSSSKYVTVQNYIDPPNTWILAAVSGGVLLLYSLSRIIALQRRVRDLEARPPVDDIVMRGMIRQQVSEMVSDLEQSIRARNSIMKPVQAKEVREVKFAPAQVPVQKAAVPLESVSVEVAPIPQPPVEPLLEKVEEFVVSEMPALEFVGNPSPKKEKGAAKTKSKKKIQE
jgi:hypothetical protein